MPGLHFVQQLRVKDRVCACMCVCVVTSRLGNPFAHGNISLRGVFRREWVQETWAFTEHLSRFPVSLMCLFLSVSWLQNSHFALKNDAGDEMISERNNLSRMRFQRFVATVWQPSLNTKIHKARHHPIGFLRSGSVIRHVLCHCNLQSVNTKTETMLKSKTDKLQLNNLL